MPSRDMLLVVVFPRAPSEEVEKGAVLARVSYDDDD